MLKKLGKAIRNPTKAVRYFSFFLRHVFMKKKNVLVFIGMESNGMFGLMYRGYKKCYCFEANPDRFKSIKKKYGNQSNIVLNNVAVSSYDGEVVFNVSNNNNGASSSIGKFKEEWNVTHEGGAIKMVRQIKVPCINLMNYLKKEGISTIDDYVSDIQGMDLEVLRTLEPWIRERRIGTITCEVAKDEKENIYADLPPNNFKAFCELLKDDYRLTARGWGVLRDGKIEDVDQEAWEMDCKWTRNEG